MIAPTIVRTGNVPTLRTAAPQPAQPQQPQASSAPVDSANLDFSAVNTAAEAAQAPILEPSFQLSLAAGLILSMASPMGGVPLIDIAMASDGDKVSSELRSMMDLKNAADPLSTTGEFAGQKLEGGLTLNPLTGQARWQTQAGGVKEDLAITFDQQNQVLHLDGRIGEVEADLDLSLLGGVGLEEFQGFVVSGELGGQSYHSRADVDMTGLGEGGPATMNVRGKLGDQAIEKDYEGVAAQTGSTITVAMQGAGTNAGNEQSIKTVFTFIP